MGTSQAIIKMEISSILVDNIMPFQEVTNLEYSYDDTILSKFVYL